MFCRCLATVCSLITSAAAISRLLFPEATSRSTSSSRSDSPWLAPAGEADARQVGRGPETLVELPGRLELERASLRRRPVRSRPARSARGRGLRRTER